MTLTNDRQPFPVDMEPRPPRLSEAQLEEIQGRVDKATSGPWFHKRYVIEPEMCGPLDRHDVTGTSVLNIASGCCDENAEFIAHARTDVPTLLAELRGSRLEVAKLRRDNNRMIVESPYDE